MKEKPFNEFLEVSVVSIYNHKKKFADIKLKENKILI